MNIMHNFVSIFIIFQMLAYTTRLLSNIILIEHNPLPPDFLSTYDLSISLIGWKFSVMIKIFLVLISICLMSSVVEFTAPKVGVIIAVAKQLYAVTLLQSDNSELPIFRTLLVYSFNILSFLIGPTNSIFS